MNLVFLSPHFPPNFYRFCRAARDRGCTVLGIADAPFHDLRSELAAALTYYYQVRDMNSYDDLCRALHYFIHHYGPIDRLDSLSEHWMETEAGLRSDFHIPGVQRDTVECIRRKSRMHEIFVAADIPCAPGERVTTADAARAFVASVGYPVIVKPDGGVGAAGTYALRTDADLDCFLRERLDANYYMEAMMTGTIESFDGLTDAQGEPIFFTSHVFSVGIMDTVNEDADLSYYSVRDVPQDLETLGRRTLAAFGIRERFFHLEFFRAPDGDLKALEVNIRPPGGLTVDMFNFACDIDVYDLWADVLLGRQAPFAYERTYHTAYVGRKWRKPYARSHDEVVAALGSTLVHHEPLSPVFARVLGDHGYLVRATNLEGIQRAVRLIQK